mgnify:CR=1 FL=1
MEECEINILEGMGRHMSYYDVITNVERKIEREQAYMELHRDALFEHFNIQINDIGYVKKNGVNLYRDLWLKKISG